MAYSFAIISNACNGAVKDVCPVPGLHTNLHVSCICSTYAVNMQYTRSAHVVHTQCIDCADAVHMPGMCHADQADHCDKDSMAIVTASLVNDVHSLLTSLSGNSPRPLPLPQMPSEAIQAVKSVNPDSIVLVSHSAGAVTAVDMLAGKLYCPVVLFILPFPCLLLPFTGFQFPFNASHCLLGGAALPSVAFMAMTEADE